jgi:uroporphyrinogen decarboxylase
LIGGIDTSVLYRGEDAVRRAVEGVLPLVDRGGFIPLLNGRVRADVPFSTYRFYRQTLETLVLDRGNPLS